MSAPLPWINQNSGVNCAKLNHHQVNNPLISQPGNANGQALNPIAPRSL
jgi:hypothetical protein